MDLLRGQHLLNSDVSQFWELHFWLTGHSFIKVLIFTDFDPQVALPQWETDMSISMGLDKSPHHSHFSLQAWYQYPLCC